MVAVMVALIGEFSSNQSRQDDSTLGDKIGLIKVGIHCASTSTLCSTIPNS